MDKQEGFHRIDPLKSKSEGLLRDRLAGERTKLAVERTFLAYIRTALAFIVVGIPAVFMFETRFIQALGGISILLGIAVAVLGVYRYAAVTRSMRGLPPSDSDDADN